MNYTEYNYKETITLKFSLPLQFMNKHNHNCHNNPNCVSDLLALPYYYSVPSLLLISLSEKTFFSDKKLGDLELNLDDLTDEK